MLVQEAKIRQKYVRDLMSQFNAIVKIKTQSQRHFRISNDESEIKTKNYAT